MSCDACKDLCSSDACNCACAGACGTAPALAAPVNAAGRSALDARIGDYGRFFADALRRLSVAEVSTPQAKETGNGDHEHFVAEALRRSPPIKIPPLRALGTRDLDDPVMSLLDAWATTADVLTFYRERLTNEGYLRTAISETSLRELAVEVGYKPRPGVAASVHLAYLLDASAAPVTIPAGAKVQTVPLPGEQMQTFETEEPLTAHAEWSEILTRRVRLPAIDRADAMTRIDIKLADTSLLVRPGERLLFLFGDAPGQQVVREVASAKNDIQNGWVAIALKPRPGLQRELARKLLSILDDLIARIGSGGRVNRLAGVLVDALVSYLLGASAMDVEAVIELLGRRGPAQIGDVDAIFQRILAFTPPHKEGIDPVRIDAVLGRLEKGAARQLHSNRLLPQAAGTGLEGEGAKRGALLKAFSPRMGDQLYAAWRALPGEKLEQDESPSLYLLRALASPYGSVAPLRSAVTRRDTDEEWPLKKVDKEFAFLESVNDAVADGSYAVIETPLTAPQGADMIKDTSAHMLRFARVRSAHTVSRGDYALNGKVTRLELADAQTGKKLTVVPGDGHSLEFLRNTVYAVQSEPVALAPEPIEDDVAGSIITLDSLYDDLQGGRWVIVSGERTDITANGKPLPGIRDGELAMIASVHQQADANSPGDTRHTVLTLASELAFSYKRSTVKIYGNVVKATHGETGAEVLGSASAQARFARFDLKRAPLTFTAAATISGVVGSQTVRVNEVRWREVDSLLDAGPSDRVYEMKVDGTGMATVLFGDGIHGARLPSGQENVRSTYRAGIGRAGNVKPEQISLLTTRPLGVRGVINPLRASGGADRDGAEQIRMNVPLAAQSLSPRSRLVSVEDYAVFARRFAGIGHAQARKLADAGSATVYVTLAGVDDIPIDPEGDLMASLLNAYMTYGDPALPVMLGVRELVALVIEARVALQPDADWDDVEPKLRARLLDAFSFARRKLGQPAYLSEAIAVMQGTPGVDWVDVNVFGGVTELEVRNADALAQAVQALQTASNVVACANAMPADDAPQQRRDLITERDGELPRLLPAQIVFLVPDVPGTLILNLVTS